MLSEKIKNYLKHKNWWFDDISDDYKNALIQIGIEQPTDIYEFYLHAEDGPTFYGRQREIYQLCWFMLNSNYHLDLKRSLNILDLPENIIPLDSFEGEKGFFYNRESGEVLELTLGKELEDFKAGKFNPQWASFNSFIEWFFEL